MKIQDIKESLFKFINKSSLCYACGFSHVVGSCDLAIEEDMNS